MQPPSGSVRINNDSTTLSSEVDVHVSTNSVVQFAGSPADRAETGYAEEPDGLLIERQTSMGASPRGRQTTGVAPRGARIGGQKGGGQG